MAEAMPFPVVLRAEAEDDPIDTAKKLIRQKIRFETVTTKLALVRDSVRGLVSS